MHSIVGSNSDYHLVLICKLLFTNSCTWKNMCVMGAGNQLPYLGSFHAGWRRTTDGVSSMKHTVADRQSLPKQQYPALVPFFLLMTKKYLEKQLRFVGLFVCVRVSPAVWRKHDKTVRELFT